MEEAGRYNVLHEILPLDTPEFIQGRKAVYPPFY